MRFDQDLDGLVLTDANEYLIKKPIGWTAGLVVAAGDTLYGLAPRRKEKIRRLDGRITSLAGSPDKSLLCCMIDNKRLATFSANTFEAHEHILENQPKTTMLSLIATQSGGYNLCDVREDNVVYRASDSIVMTDELGRLKIAGMASNGTDTYFIAKEYNKAIRASNLQAKLEIEEPVEIDKEKIDPYLAIMHGNELVVAYSKKKPVIIPHSIIESTETWHHLKNVTTRTLLDVSQRPYAALTSSDGVIYTTRDRHYYPIYGAKSDIDHTWLLDGIEHAAAVPMPLWLALVERAGVMADD